MYRAFPIACLTLGLLAPAARADDANRYEIVVVPASATPGDGKTETLLIDFDPTTFAAKSTYWVSQPFKVLPPEDDKPLLPPN
jgi:hypothetical protein